MGRTVRRRDKSSLPFESLEVIDYATPNVISSRQMCARGVVCSVPLCPFQHADDMIASDSDHKIVVSHRVHASRARSMIWSVSRNSSRSFAQYQYTGGMYQPWSTYPSFDMISCSQPITDICVDDAFCTNARCPLLHPNGMLLFQLERNTSTSFDALSQDRRFAHHHSDACEGITSRGLKFQEHINVKQKKEKSEPVSFSADLSIEQCDYCGCCCHRFPVCLGFRKTKRDSPRALSPQMLTIGCSNWYPLLNFFTSSFIVVFCSDNQSDDGELLLLERKRVLTNELYVAPKHKMMTVRHPVGGKRISLLEDPLACALRNFQSILGPFLEFAGTKNVVQQSVNKLWQKNELTVYVDQYFSEVTIFAEIPSSAMAQLKNCMSGFRVIPQFSTGSEYRVVVLCEKEILKQLTKFRMARQIQTDRQLSPIRFKNGDISSSTMKVIDHLNITYSIQSHTNNVSQQKVHNSIVESSTKVKKSKKKRRRQAKNV